jgi:hypothetical protein
MTMKDYDRWKLQNDRDDTPFNEPEPEPEPEPVGICEHCNRWIFDGDDYLVSERHSGPSVHYLYFHQGCYRCPKCGTNGPHYCPGDIARD